MPVSDDAKVEDYGNLAAVRTRGVLAMLLYHSHHYMLSPGSASFAHSSREFWESAKAFFLANIHPSTPDEIRIAVLNYLNAMPLKTRNRRNVPDELERMLLLVAIGTWEDFGLPEALVGGPPTSTLRDRILTGFSEYCQGVINMVLPDFTPITGAAIVPTYAPNP